MINYVRKSNIDRMVCRAEMAFLSQFVPVFSWINVRKTRVCGHLYLKYCSQMHNCVYILSFGLKTRCRDCYCAMTSSYE